MSEFEYSSGDSDSESSDDEDDVVLRRCATTRKKPNIHTVRVLRELRLYYSNVFADSFYLIDSFVKSKRLTYDSFLRQFDAAKFHQIYSNTASEVQNVTVSPHHFITTAQDALAVASKFLRSRSKSARIGAIYLLYTLWKTQPLKIYPLNVKMESRDYVAAKELVRKCLDEGLLHPAYCFHSLASQKKITITSAVVNPCMEANYPRLEIRKHMGRVADRYFQTEYEEREELNLADRFRLVEQQVCNELAYMNRLSVESMKRDLGVKFEAVLSRTLEDIRSAAARKSDDAIEPQSKDADAAKKGRYKSSKNIAFPGVNEDKLEDMVTCEVPQKHVEPISDCDTKKKRKKKKRTVSGTKNSTLCNASVLKEHIGTSSPPLSVLMKSDSDCSVADSSDDNQYDQMIMRILEG